MAFCFYYSYFVTLTSGVSKGKETYDVKHKTGISSACFNGLSHLGYAVHV